MHFKRFKDELPRFGEFILLRTIIKNMPVYATGYLEEEPFEQSDWYEDHLGAVPYDPDARYLELTVVYLSGMNVIVEYDEDYMWMYLSDIINVEDNSLIHDKYIKVKIVIPSGKFRTDAIAVFKTKVDGRIIGCENIQEADALLTNDVDFAKTMSKSSNTKRKIYVAYVVDTYRRLGFFDGGTSKELLKVNLYHSSMHQFVRDQWKYYKGQ